jgi:hypothetical protein
VVLAVVAHLLGDKEICILVKVTHCFCQLCEMKGTQWGYINQLNLLGDLRLC